MRLGESENWMRQSALTFLLSVLEVYFRAVVRAALVADPLLIPGFPKRVDGLAILKQGPPRLSLDLVDRCASGTWQARVASYGSLFTTVPPVLQEHLADLEAMRKLRNQFAHESGREGLTAQGGRSAASYAGLRALDRIRLSEERLKKFFGVVFEVASSVDDHLAKEHIGDWEVLELLHLWRTDRAAIEGALGAKAVQSERRAHSGVIKYIARTTGFQATGSTYFRQLATYYRACTL